MRVTIAGSGYVGLVTGACLAETGNIVVGYDIDPTRVDELNRGICPIYEPGLVELIQANRQADRLRFTRDIKEAIDHAEIVFIAIGTPPNAEGDADLSSIEAFARDMAPLVTRSLTVAIKSTVPVGTGEHVERIINSRSLARVDVVSNPEFLKEGNAVNDFKRPDRVVIGAEVPEAADVIRELYLPFLRSGHPVILMRRTAAELTKYASNACLAARISFINEIANLCDKLGIDVDEVRHGMGTDPRIGPQFLYPGAGYGGSCFPKDVQALTHTARKAGMEAGLMAAVHRVNEGQKRLLFSKIQDRFADSLRGKTCAIWGISFKPNTDDIREAPAINLIESLLAAGVKVRAHDPKALPNLRKVFQGRIQYCERPYEAVQGADFLAICTEWNAFRSPDFQEIKRQLKSGVIFDGRNLYEPTTLRRYGLEYYPIGRPAVKSKE